MRNIGLRCATESLQYLHCPKTQKTLRSVFGQYCRVRLTNWMSDFVNFLMPKMDCMYHWNLGGCHWRYWFNCLLLWPSLTFRTVSQKKTNGHQMKYFRESFNIIAKYCMSLVFGLSRKCTAKVAKLGWSLQKQMEVCYYRRGSLQSYEMMVGQTTAWTVKQMLEKHFRNWGFFEKKLGRRIELQTNSTYKCHRKNLFFIGRYRRLKCSFKLNSKKYTAYRILKNVLIGPNWLRFWKIFENCRVDQYTVGQICRNKLPFLNYKSLGRN